MGADKTNLNGEPMTLERLAQMIEHNLPKKEDFSALVKKVEVVDHKVDSLELKIDALEHTMTEGFRLVHEEIKMLNFAVEIDDLRGRMKRVEQKLGL